MNSATPITYRLLKHQARPEVSDLQGTLQAQRRSLTPLGNTPRLGLIYDTDAVWHEVSITTR